MGKIIGLTFPKPKEQGKPKKPENSKEQGKPEMNEQ